MENGVEVKEKVVAGGEVAEIVAKSGNEETSEDVNGGNSFDGVADNGVSSEVNGDKGLAEIVPDIPVTKAVHENGSSDNFETKDESNGVDGFKLDEHHETEQSSRTEEITELSDRTEVRVHETKEVTLEEVLSKENQRPVSEAELQALLEADFGNGEVEIGKDITIEEFTRVELSHEESVDGKVLNASSVVKEEHKVEEIEESSQYVKSTAVEAQNGEPGVDINDKPEAQNGEPGVDINDKPEEISKEAEASESVAETEPKLENEPADVAKDVASEPEASELTEASKVTGEAEVADKNTKSRGLIGYIKAKTRSLSRDRSRTSAKLEDEADVKSTEKKSEPNPEDSKSEKKKFKLNLFGKKSEDLTDDKDLEKNGQLDSEGSKTKLPKLILFSKKGKEKEEGEHAEEVDVSKEQPEEKETKSKSHFFGKKDKKKTAIVATTTKDSEDKPAEQVPEGEQQTNEKTEDIIEGKTKDHKWYHFGRKSEKESTDDKPEKENEEETKDKEPKWSLFGKKKEVSKAEVDKEEKKKPEVANVESENQEKVEADVEHQDVSVTAAETETAVEKTTDENVDEGHEKTSEVIEEGVKTTEEEVVLSEVQTSLESEIEGKENGELDVENKTDVADLGTPEDAPPVLENAKVEVSASDAPPEENLASEEAPVAEVVVPQVEEIVEDKIVDQEIDESKTHEETVETPEDVTNVEETENNDVAQENPVSDSEAETKKDAKEHRKFSFGLKLGHKKDAKVDEGGQKEKDNWWSPFAKKPTKKDKEENVEGEKVEKTAAEDVPEDGKEAETEHVDAEKDEEKQVETKKDEENKDDGKKPKGIKKLFTFGKKTKSVDESQAAGDTGADTSDESKKNTPTHEAKPDKHKKFSFGIKFGKKVEKEVSASDLDKNEEIEVKDEVKEPEIDEVLKVDVEEAEVTPIPVDEAALNVNTEQVLETDAEAVVEDVEIKEDTENIVEAVAEPYLAQIPDVIPEFEVMTEDLNTTASIDQENQAQAESVEEVLNEERVEAPEIQPSVEETGEHSEEIKEIEKLVDDILTGEPTNVNDTVEVGANDVDAVTEAPEVEINAPKEIPETSTDVIDVNQEKPITPKEVSTTEVGEKTTESETEQKTPKKFSFGFKFGKKAKNSESKEKIHEKPAEASEAGGDPKAEPHENAENAKESSKDEEHAKVDEKEKHTDAKAENPEEHKTPKKFPFGIHFGKKAKHSESKEKVNDLPKKSFEEPEIIITAADADQDQEVEAGEESNKDAAPIEGVAVDGDHPVELQADETAASECILEAEKVAVTESAPPPSLTTEEPVSKTEEPATAVEADVAQVEPTPAADGKDQKSHKKFPFNIKLGKKPKQDEGVDSKKEENVAEVNESAEAAENGREDAGKGEHESSKDKTFTETPVKHPAKAENGEETKAEEHHGIKWPHFGKKTEKNQPEVVVDDSVHDSSKINEDEKSSQPKSKAHQIGKGLLKIFSPKKQKPEKSDKVGGKEENLQEAVILYSVEEEGRVVAETHWRPKASVEEREEPKPDLENLKLSNESTQDNEHVVSNGEVAEHPHTSSSSDHFVVVAIDFGTTFSGYAFSFVHDPDSIHMMRKWEGGDPGVINQKTPTILMLTPDGEFHSFGFTARDFYHDMDSAEAGKWMYFEKFKMELHHKMDLNEDMTITSSNGKQFPAMKLFSYALRYFKDHALTELSSQSSVTIEDKDIRWVITVPAIWKAPAKQFMRQAAYQAGIASPECSDRLLIALEPEAASIYIRKLRMNQLVPERPTSLPLSPSKVQNSETTNDEVISDQFKAGTRYMVVDCGGGTVDITVHEMESAKGHLKELYKATGGPYGSTGVDREFERLLVEIFGEEFIESFKSKRPAGWVDLMIAFESRKRAANPHKDNALNVSLPFSFIDYHKKYFGSQVDVAIKKYGDKDIRWSLQGMLRLMPDAMLRLFQPTLDSIKNAIAAVLNNPQVQGIEYIFLVGGFSESSVLQHEVRKEFEQSVRIIIPQDVSLTILKGAVCFGVDPTVITQRQSRMTYGVGIVNRFVPDLHPESKRVNKDGIDWCVDVFDTFVAANQAVTLGSSVIRRYAPASQDQKAVIIKVYCSESSEVQFVTDPGVQKCATLQLDVTDFPVQDPSTSSSKLREIQTCMTFGDTEIKVTTIDVETGLCVRSGIDFLNK